jgi:hypothetical protein
MAPARTAPRADGGRTDDGRRPQDDDDDDRGPGAGRRDTIRMGKIRELYTDLIAPSPTLILTGQKSVRHIFTADVRGRVTPAGEFMDPEAVNEYFFGLATTPTSHVARVDLPPWWPAGTSGRGGRHPLPAAGRQRVHLAADRFSSLSTATTASSRSTSRS